MYQAITRSQIFVLDQDQALDFYVNTLGLELADDIDLGFMRWLTVRVPGDPGREILLEIPGPPAMDEATAEQVRDLLTKGAMGGWLCISTDDAQRTHDELAERGVDITDAPAPRPYGIDFGIRDPFGNAIRIGELFPTEGSAPGGMSEPRLVGRPGPMSRAAGFDRDAAVTRSLLGYGVVAGVCYLTIGLILAATRDGFDLARHPLSLLMLREGGWMQRANLIVAGAMVLAASVGLARALRGSSSGRRAGALLGVYGGAVVASGVFAPDPIDGFPPGIDDGDVSFSGIVHLTSGAVGFVSLALGCLVVARWSSPRGASGMASYSRITAAVIMGGFVTGAALSSETAGIVALWVAVVAGWLWFAVTSVHVYRKVPTQIGRRRAPHRLVGRSRLRNALSDPIGRSPSVRAYGGGPARSTPTRRRALCLITTRP